MHRFFIGLVALAVIFSVTSDLIPQDNPGGARIAELQDQLESGLKARRPVEFAFIARVVARVEDQQLTTGEVKSVFQWARRKNKHSPFPYFERAMRIIAARKKVEL